MEPTVVPAESVVASDVAPSKETLKVDRLRFKLDWENEEFKSTLGLTVVFTVLDSLFVLIGAFSTKSPVGAVIAELFHGFLLSLVASLCVATLIRWRRHHSEILAAVADNHGTIFSELPCIKAEILTQMARNHSEISNEFPRLKSLRESGEFGQVLTEVITDYAAIQEKHWPPFASRIVLDELKELAELTKEIRSGKAILPLDVGTRLSPRFFKQCRGLSVATDYCDIDYWSSDHGKWQLASNAQVYMKRGARDRLFEYLSSLPTETAATFHFMSLMASWSTS